MQSVVFIIASNTSGSPSGRETPVNGLNDRWHPSPSSYDPYLWTSYHPSDPYFMYNYISDLHAAYGLPPLPPPSYTYIRSPTPVSPSPSPINHNPRYQNYFSDNEEQGYSSTDELAQYYNNYRRNFSYSPYRPDSQISFKVNKTFLCRDNSNREKTENFIKINDKENLKKDLDVVSKENKIENDESSESETDTEKENNNEEEEEGIRLQKSGTLQTLKSVSDINIYSSESLTTTTSLSNFHRDEIKSESEIVVKVEEEEEEDLDTLITKLAEIEQNMNSNEKKRLDDEYVIQWVADKLKNFLLK